MLRKLALAAGLLTILAVAALFAPQEPRQIQVSGATWSSATAL